MTLNDSLQHQNRVKLQGWRGFSLVHEVHEKRYTKRAGVAGIALRAVGGDGAGLVRLSASLWRRVD